MKLATQVMMLAATAGIAVIALTTRKPTDQAPEGDAREAEAHPPAHAAVDSDAWFV